VTTGVIVIINVVAMSVMDVGETVIVMAEQGRLCQIMAKQQHARLDVLVIYERR
jgi:hypothetical protein